MTKSIRIDPTQCAAHGVTMESCRKDKRSGCVARMSTSSETRERPFYWRQPRDPGNYGYWARSGWYQWTERGLEYLGESISNDEAVVVDLGSLSRNHAARGQGPNTPPPANQEVTNPK